MQGSITQELSCVWHDCRYVSSGIALHQPGYLCTVTIVANNCCPGKTSHCEDVVSSETKFEGKKFGVEMRFLSFPKQKRQRCCCRDQWLDCARVAFASMDLGDKGHIESSQLVSLLSTKLPAEEVEHAVEDALMEAGCGG